MGIGDLLNKCLSLLQNADICVQVGFFAGYPLTAFGAARKLSGTLTSFSGSAQHMLHKAMSSFLHPTLRQANHLIHTLSEPPEGSY